MRDIGVRGSVMLPGVDVGSIGSRTLMSLLFSPRPYLGSLTMELRGAGVVRSAVACSPATGLTLGAAVSTLHRGVWSALALMLIGHTRSGFLSDIRRVQRRRASLGEAAAAAPCPGPLVLLGGVERSAGLATRWLGFVRPPVVELVRTASGGPAALSVRTGVVCLRLPVRLPGGSEGAKAGIWAAGKVKGPGRYLRLLGAKRFGLEREAMRWGSNGSGRNGSSGFVGIAWASW